MFNYYTSTTTEKVDKNGQLNKTWPSYFVESNLTIFVANQVGVFVYEEGPWKIIAFCF